MRYNEEFKKKEIRIPIPILHYSDINIDRQSTFNTRGLTEDFVNTCKDINELKRMCMQTFKP